MNCIIPGVVKVGKYMLIGEDIYERYRTDDYRIKAHDLGSGHLEMVAQSQYDYYELEFGDWREERERKARKLAEIRRMIKARDNPSPEQIAEREERSALAGARRATTKVRRLCKVMEVDTLVTGTYRENIEDLDICKAHVKEYVRRMRRYLPDFGGVVAFERQERGAWHWHMATRRMPMYFRMGSTIVRSYDLARSVWRSVTKQAGGNIDVSQSKSRDKRSPARIASYISKYITKAFEDGDKWSNRWSKFGEGVVPKPVDLGLWPSMRAAVEACYELVTQSGSVVTQVLSNWGDFFFLVIEKNHTKLPPDK